MAANVALGATGAFTGEGSAPKHGSNPPTIAAHAPRPMVILEPGSHGRIRCRRFARTLVASVMAS